MLKNAEQRERESDASFQARLKAISTRGGKDTDQLMLWPEPLRAAPSATLRSALFGILRRGEREYIDGETLVAWKGTSIRYTGKRLDQYDLDVWMQAIHLGRHQDIGNVVHFTARSFLKAMGRKVSGYSANTLFESLERMVACAVTIKVDGISFTGSLVEMFARDEHSDRYVVRLNPELRQLFDTGHTRLHWETRLALPTDLARWLHGYVLSHQATKDAPHRIGVKQLHGLTGSSAAALWKFRETLKRAMGALEQASVVSSWRITEGDALEFVRPKIAEST